MNTVESLLLQALTTYSVNYDIPWQMPSAMDAREGLAVLGGGACRGLRKAEMGLSSDFSSTSHLPEGPREGRQPAREPHTGGG